MKSKLEHAKPIVKNIDETILFLRTALPDFVIRNDATNKDGNRWVHIGNSDYYISLNSADIKKKENNQMPYSGRIGLNHLGFIVHDVDEVRSRLISAGYIKSTECLETKYRKSIYFYDNENRDWEFVQYFTADREEKNNYLVDPL